MKKLGFLLAAVFFLSVGLSGAYGYKSDLQPPATVPEVQKTGVKVAEAKDAMKQEGKKFEKAVQKKLGEYNKKMKEMEAKGKKLKGKAKEEAKEEMKEMKGKVAEAEQKLKSMKSATGEAWEKAKAEVESAMENVEGTYKKLAARFK